jgi:hypothetical protein
VVVGHARDRPADVQRVDGVAGLLAAVGAQVWRAVGGLVMARDHGQRPVRHVAGVALFEGGSAAWGRVGFLSFVSCSVLLGEHLERAVGAVAGIALSE